MNPELILYALIAVVTLGVITDLLTKIKDKK